MKATVNTKEFKRVIRSLSPFTRLDVGKMQYIRLTFDYLNQEVKAEALDGCRVGVEFLNCETDCSFVAYVKPFIIWKTDAISCDIELINSNAIVTIGDHSIKCKQLEGEWYNTKQIFSALDDIPPIFRIGVNPSLMIEALKNMKTDGGNGCCIIEMRHAKDAIVIRNKKDNRNIKLVLPMTING